MLSSKLSKPHQIFVQFPSQLDPERPWHAILDENSYMLAQSLAGVVLNPCDQIILGFGCHFTCGIQLAQAPIRLNSSLKQVEMFVHGVEGHIEDQAHDRLIMQIHRFLGLIWNLKEQFYPESPRSMREKTRFFIEKWMPLREPLSAFVLSAPIDFEASTPFQEVSGKVRSSSPSPRAISLAPSLPHRRGLGK